MKAKKEILKDEDNPEFLFNAINTSLLKDIINGKIDPVYLAKKEMANRGLNKNGKWISFDKARREYNLMKYE